MKSHDSETIKEDIMKSALAIMELESLDAISIRKIAVQIDCPPSLIYHYYKDKQSIINELLLTKYSAMNQAMRQAVTPHEQPEAQFSQALRVFIEFACAQDKDYVAVMSSQDPVVLSHTAVLFEGVSAQKPGFGMMTRHIQAITNKPLKEAEMDALVIWSATVGLIIRMHTEKTSDAFRKALIEHHINYHLNALKHMAFKPKGEDL